MIFYNKVLNAAEILIVNNYLSAKYGLALVAAADLYDNDNAPGNFDYDVAGVGQAANNTQTNLTAQSSIVTVDISSGATGLGNNEYYIWGHNNGALTPTNAGLPLGVQARLLRTWAGSESGSITNFDSDLT